MPSGIDQGVAAFDERIVLGAWCVQFREFSEYPDKSLTVDWLRTGRATLSTWCLNAMASFFSLCGGPKPPHIRFYKDRGLRFYGS